MLNIFPIKEIITFLEMTIRLNHNYILYASMNYIYVHCYVYFMYISVTK